MEEMIESRVEKILENIKKRHICSFREENLSEKEKASIISNLEKNRHRVEERYEVNQGGGIPKGDVYTLLHIMFPQRYLKVNRTIKYIRDILKIF